jgi:hypothetical protein
MKELLAQYNAAKKIASEEIGGDYRTRPGREMLRNQARSQLPELEKKLNTAFQKVGFPVFLDGPGVESFFKLASDVTDTVLVDFNQATHEIQSGVDAAMGHRFREFSPASFAVMLREIRQAASTLGLTSIPNINYDGVECLATKKEVAECVNRYIIKYLGAGFLAEILTKEALQQLLVKGCSNPVVPVLLTNVPVAVRDDVTPKLFQGKVLEVEAKTDVTEKDVVAAFKKIQTIRKAAN